jgi:hypothetical protein
MKKILILLQFTFLISCANVVTYKTLTSSNNHKFNRTDKFYIVTPKDGQYGNTNYNNSGQMTSGAIQKGLMRYVDQVTLSSGFENSVKAEKKAIESNQDYLVTPTILHWEDRSTEWSGKSDLVSVKISIEDLKQSKIISSVMIDGKSGKATFGGDHPQDLLPEPIRLYLAELFQNMPK